MAPLPDLPSTLKVELVYSDGVGQFGSRIFMQYAAAAPDADDISNYADDIAANWLGNMAPVTGPPFSLIQVAIEDLTSPTNASGQWTGSHSGGGSSEALPSNCSMDIEFNIGIRYRGGRPLVHNPPGSAVDLATAREWTTAYAGDCLSAWESFITAISTDSHIPGSTLQHCVARGFRNPPPSSGTHVVPVVSYKERLTVGTTRRRLSTAA